LSKSKKTHSKHATPTLNQKQKTFVREYLVDLNATQAAIRAGYSKKTARSIGDENLSKPAIAAAIEKAVNKRAAKLEITAERVLQAIASKAFSNMEDYVSRENGDLFTDFSKVTRDQMAAVQEITVDQYAGGAGDAVREQVKRTRFKLADQLRALELLGKHLELFTDKLKLSGSLKTLTDEELEVKYQELLKKLHS